MRNLARLVIATAVVSGVGCTLLVDVDGLSVPDAGGDDAPRAKDGGRDASAKADGGPARDATADVAVDALIDAGTDAPPPVSLKTRVACAEPKSCADREACCIVYGNHEDYCVKNDADCTWPDSTLVVIRCDDETDCTALGFPGTVCCATIPNGLYGEVKCMPREQCKAPQYVQLCDAVLQSCPDGTQCKRAVRTSDMWECQ